MNHTSPIRDCLVCPRIDGHLDLKGLPLNHPNRVSKTGQTFSQEIASAIEAGRR